MQNNTRSEKDDEYAVAATARKDDEKPEHVKQDTQRQKKEKYNQHSPQNRLILSFPWSPAFRALSYHVPPKTLRFRRANDRDMFLR